MADAEGVELFNLLINPVSHDFALRWHRDDVREDATPEEELRSLMIWHYGVSVSPLAESFDQLGFENGLTTN